GIESLSFFNLSQQAPALSSEAYIFNTMGDYPIGFMQYFIFALIIANAFVFIYGLIGFILTLSGKQTNFLSSRIKRWSMAFLIIYYLIYVLAFCSIAVLVSTPIFDGISAFLPIGYILMFLPALPYAFATLCSVNKK
ncbi:MAG: hypothetical protein J5779_01015, partial [Clostridia bacterium]|nr:hypothetical protein [Clostridia bacterium]